MGSPIGPYLRIPGLLVGILTIVVDLVFPFPGLEFWTGLILGGVFTWLSARELLRHGLRPTMK